MKIRNLIPLLVVALFVNRTHADDPEQGFKPIFDGQSLDGWSGQEGFWKVENGVIVGETTAEHPLKKNTFLVWEQGEVDDFELRLKFRISGTDRANSGIQFRGTQREDGHVVGYQADIDRAGKWIGACYDEAARGLLAGRGQKATVNQDGKPQREDIADAQTLLEHISIDDWNDYSITARGDHIVLKINGQVTAEVIDHDPQGLDRIGKLALQLHTGPPMKVEFKDIRLKRFPLESGWKKVVFVAGTPSHGYFSHEHNAGCLLLSAALDDARAQQGLPVISTVYTNGWPKDPTAFDNADTVVSYCDGGKRHYLNDHLEDFDRLVQERGVGLACLHYAVETVPGAPGDHFLKWIGGYFEPFWSVNPHWVAKFEELPKHPITRGVSPFQINDEWYYHMRFVPEMKGVTPILTDLPPRETLNRPDGAHSGNPAVREAVLEKKEPQVLAWAYERPEDKGRGFGFTGGHFHVNWQHDDFRKLVLNAIVWTAQLDVPDDGVVSKTPDEAELKQNQDEQQPEKFQFQPIKQSAKADKSADAKDQTSQHDVSGAVEQLDVHPDLKATLFASEPMMSNPASIDVDHLGRVWVCEAINYRAFRNADVIGKDQPGDRILILEDTDHDAKADKSTVFYQGHDVDSAHGILVLPTPDGPGTRALVSAGEDVFYLIDDDGDSKADRKELLFTGIAGEQHDHGIHAFQFGPDGKLYFNFGNAGKHIRDKNGKPIVDKAGNEVNDSRNPYQEGMVFRCNLDGSEFETLAWNFRNNWEVCVDSFGTLWQSDNDDDGNQGVRINYVMEYGNYGYKDELTGATWKTPRTNWEAEIPRRHWHLNDPGVVPNLLQTGAGAPTGICIYEGHLLPKSLYGAVIHCDAGPNICRAYVTQRDGAGFSAEVVNLLNGVRNNWFRPSDVCIAPDGSLLVADWYDPGVGGHRMLDPRRGRLYRLAPKSTQGYSSPRIDVLTPQGAVTALQSPNMSTRYLAWTALKANIAKAEEQLLSVWKSAEPRMRARALWAFCKLTDDNDKRAKALRSGLSDPNESIRVASIRLLRQLMEEVPYADVEGSMDVHDSSPAVRRAMLIALRDLDLNWIPPDMRDGFRGRAWSELAQQYDGQDRWYLEALGIAAAQHWDECLTAWLEDVGEDWKSTKAGRDIVWRSRSSETTVLLAELIQSPSTPADEIPRYLRALDFQTSPSRQQVLEQLAFHVTGHSAEQRSYIQSEALSRLKNVDFKSNPDQRKALQKVLVGISGTEQFVRLVDRFSLDEQYPELLELACENPQSQIAVEALNTLYDKKQQKLIHEALAEDNREHVEPLVTALTTAADRRSIPELLAIIKDEVRPLWLRQAAIKAVAASYQGAQALLEIAQGQKYPPELKPALAAALTTAQWLPIQEGSAKLFPPPPGKNATPLPPISELVERKGDTSHGGVVFNTVGTCNKCHQVNGIGTEIGPNLSEIGKKLSKPALYESILYPSAAISHNYENWLVLTLDGQIYSGLLVNETELELKIKDDKGIIRTIPVVTIEARKKQDVSLMPADLQKLMTADELVDLVEYLTTLKKRRL